MILFLIEWLRNVAHIHIPHVFEYTSTRIMLSLVTGLFLAIFLGPKCIKKLYEWKIGQPIRDDAGFLLAELHKNKKNTPTMGGALIIFSIALSSLLWADLRYPFPFILLGTLFVFGSLGAYDDYLKLRYKNPKGLSARKKMLVQLLVSLFVAAYLQIPAFTDSLNSFFHLKTPQVVSIDTHISLQEYSSVLLFPFFKDPVVVFSGLGIAVLWAWYAFVIVGSSNAVNLTDGLDGLASGLIIFVSASLGIVAFLMNNMEFSEYLNIFYLEGSGEIAVVLFAMLGACLGFLWFNCQPAQVFMGDTGSLSMGGMIGVAAVLLKREFFLGLVGAIFVAEALSVILQVISFKYFNQRRIFLCAPLHHHFEYKGWPESKVVIRFWIVGFILSMIGLASLKFQ